MLINEYVHIHSVSQSVTQNQFLYCHMLHASLIIIIIIINEEIIVAFSHKTTRTRYKVKTQNRKLRHV